MINTVSSFYMLGVAEAGMLLQFPFLVREKGALIDRQSLSCISLPQVATGLRFACRARSVGGAFSQTCSCRRGHSCAEGVPTASLLPNQKKMLSEINAGYGRKGESYHGDISLYSKDCRAQ